MMNKYVTICNWKIPSEFRERINQEKFFTLTVSRPEKLQEKIKVLDFFFFGANKKKVSEIRDCFWEREKEEQVLFFLRLIFFLTYFSEFIEHIEKNCNFCVKLIYAWYTIVLPKPRFSSKQDKTIVSLKVHYVIT